MHVCTFLGDGSKDDDMTKLNSDLIQNDMTKDQISQPEIGTILKEFVF